MKRSARGPHGAAPRGPTPGPVVRCAIYTRKSTEEGLQQEFNSLDAQREAGEAYIASQQHEGWLCLPDRYDDGGFTGGNMDRPALQRLMADSAAGRIDLVVCYKVDRLSRSLLDFAKMMETFDRHGVSFVSVTQQFNTANSMGRLVLNVLLSFAQFEREIIAERTRDKIASTRRKGKWTGGLPVLGYDVDPRSTRLVVNEAEAAQVRAIFQLYLEHQALLPVVQELNRRGWVGKRWTARAGHTRGGVPFTKAALHRLLTNVLYVGKVTYKDETHPGEHPALIDPDTWQQVQAALERNRRAGGVRSPHSALLKGLLRCRPCGRAMTPTSTRKGGVKQYRYYVCSEANQRGRQCCPSKSVPAGAIEAVVVQRLQAVGQDPVLVRATLAQARVQAEERQAALAAERKEQEQVLTRAHATVRSLAQEMAEAADPGPLVARLADAQEQVRQAEGRVAALRDQQAALVHDVLDEDAAAAALAAFAPVWASLAPAEQARLVGLLVERVEYDGAAGAVALTFHPTGLRTLAAELLRPPAETPR